jgi:hypothetical protein
MSMVRNVFGLNQVKRLWLCVLTMFVAVTVVVSLLGAIRVSVASKLAETNPQISALARSFTPIAGGNYPNCRFGAGGMVESYAVSSLNLGWHMDWSARSNPSHPNGAEYVQVVRLKSDLSGLSFTPPTATLLAILSSNPGSTWLIGNEPDSPVQDNLLAVENAQLYRRLYYLIKEHDPSAQVGVGNIVQPTPLRMLYLDRMLESYQRTYGEPLPADLWSIHSYVLREIDPADPEAVPNGPYEVWGAGIPPGLTTTRGILYQYSEMFSLTIFQQRLLAFRAWMRDRGYGDRPLYITEYGTLFPYPPYISYYWTDEQGGLMTEVRTAAYMTRTFNLLRQLKDTGVGYAADEYRLVQRWLWYSVSDPTYGGILFDPTTHARRPLGDVYAAYTGAISPEVDLLAVRVVTDPPVVSYTGGLVTVSLKALVSNVGNISITPPVTVSFYAGIPTSSTLIGRQVISRPIDGCAHTVWVSQTWPNLNAGAHPVYIEVDASNPSMETTRNNNRASGLALVATHRVYLPEILRE